jgi:dTDP-4-amino-4,6-dideoxygalactose transaminase
LPRESSPRAGRRTPVIGVGTLTINERAKRLVLEALDNGRLSYGPLTQQFEAEFARRHGCRFAVMCNSGTSALQIALQAMKERHGWTDGDEVIVPAITFVATVNIVLHNRLQPVLVDVDPVHYDIAVSQIERAITPRTRAVIPVHVFGQPADMDPVLEVAARHGLEVLEDSAETMFASYKGKRVGGFGSIACFSTYVAHLIVTGVGGLALTNDPDYAIRLRSLMNHGRDSIYIGIDDDDDRTPQELRTIVARRFQFTSVGHSFRVTELEGALGLAHLDDSEHVIAARRANARMLTERLRHLDAHLQLPSTRPGSEHSFMMFPIVLRERPKVDLVNFLEQHGVETRDMLPLTNQPVYHRMLGWREDDFPVARWINSNGFYVGCHHSLGEPDLAYVAELGDRSVSRDPTRARQCACLVHETHNSEGVLAQRLDDVPRELFDRIVAVDRQSTDGTADVLKAYGIEVLPLTAEDALRMVVDGALTVEQPSVVFLEADGRSDARDVGRLLLTLERGHDMVVTSRFLHGGARHDRERPIRYRSIGNRGLTLAANLLFYGNFTDALHPFRAVKLHRLTSVKLDEAGLPGFYQLSILAMKDGWKIAEIPTTERITRGTKDLVDIVLSVPPMARVLVKEWWRGRRQRARRSRP